MPPPPPSTSDVGRSALSGSGAPRGAADRREGVRRRFQRPALSGVPNVTLLDDEGNATGLSVVAEDPSWSHEHILTYAWPLPPAYEARFNVTDHRGAVISAVVRPAPQPDAWLAVSSPWSPNQLFLTTANGERSSLVVDLDGASLPGGGWTRP